MIFSLIFKFKPSELKKVKMSGIIFNQIDFDSVTVTNKYDTLESLTSVIFPYEYDQSQSVLNSIHLYGCYYRIGATTINIFIDLDSDNLDPETKDIIKMYIRDANLNRILE